MAGKADAPTKEQEIKTVNYALFGQLGEDWKTFDTRAGDKYVYVTVKRLRAVAAPMRPYADEIGAHATEIARAAFTAYRLDLQNRALPLRLLTIPPILRASP